VAELLGTHSYQLDPKGRISLPSRFREAFADGAYLTLGQDGCLFCFPAARWEDRSAEVRAAPLSDTEGRAYARMFFGNAEPVEIDTQGRIVVPPLLRDSASIVGDVRVFGKIDYLEVWNEERFAQKLARDQWTDEDGLRLSEHGI
jgi:MraZ protein